MEGSQSGKRAWRMASKAETRSGQWKPSISEYTCIRVNGGRYSIQKRYVASAARVTMVLVRGVVNYHHHPWLWAACRAAWVGHLATVNGMLGRDVTSNIEFRTAP